LQPTDAPAPRFGGQVLGRARGTHEELAEVGHHLVLAVRIETNTREDRSQLSGDCLTLIDAD